jgi:SH3-like domain-containing protein
MFRITQDPSSRSTDSYLIKTTRNGSTVLVVCAVGVWRNIQDCNGEGNYVSSTVKIRVKAKRYNIYLDLPCGDYLFLLGRAVA